MTAPAARTDLLFLCHRIPYPPNKGDKIRSFHLLRFLAERYRVHLGAFIDDPDDWRHQARVAELCASSCLLPLRPLVARLRGLTGLMTGQPLTVPYYRDQRLAAWVRDTWARHAIRHVLVFSSAMGQYVLGEAFRGARRVVDFVDVDSDKWRQYAPTKPFYSAWLFRREAARLELFDKALARACDLSLFVSPQEATLFRDLLRDARVRVDHLTNGVDTDFFAPDPGRPNPFAEGQRPLVFTGAMDYWANVEAVIWFAQRVLPRILERVPEARFHIVGGRPTEPVRRLAGPAVVVTGAVPDVRPYLQHAAAAVAPLRIARGIQNKVLEGMAMARPVVVTPKGLEGIDARDGQDLLVAETPEAFAAGVCQILEAGEGSLGENARRQVCRAHGWEASLNRFGEMLDA